MGRNSKRESRLRAEVEILKTRLREREKISRSGLSPSPVSDLIPNAWPVTGGQLPVTETFLPNLRKDLVKSFFLTVISVAFIFLLKSVVLPNQAFVTRFVSDLYRNATSVVSGISRR